MGPDRIKDVTGQLVLPGLFAGYTYLPEIQGSSGRLSDIKGNLQEALLGTYPHFL